MDSWAASWAAPKAFELVACSVVEKAASLVVRLAARSESLVYQSVAQRAAEWAVLLAA